MVNIDKNINFWAKEFFSVRLFPKFKIETNSDYKKRMVFAQLLSYSVFFNQSIVEARKMLKLNKIIPLVEKSTIEEIFSLESKYFSASGLFVLEDISAKICIRHYLPANWMSIIKILLMTNILYILPDSLISFHYPINDLNPPLSRLMLTKATPPFNGLGDATEAYRLSRKAAIIINEQMSPSKLAELIRKNQREVNKLMSTVGKSTISQTKERTLFWGCIAAIFIDEGITSWSAMDKLINASSSNNPFTAETKDPILSTPPDATTLETYYHNFERSLKKISS